MSGNMNYVPTGIAWGVLNSYPSESWSNQIYYEPSFNLDWSISLVLIVHTILMFVFFLTVESRSWELSYHSVNIENTTP